MSTITQCPSCLTTFRVTPQQLQAHHGMVRCGRCSAVFDGFKSLGTLPDDVPSPPAQPAPGDDGRATPQQPSETIETRRTETLGQKDEEPLSDGKVKAQQDAEPHATADESAPQGSDDKDEILAPHELGIASGAASAERPEHDEGKREESAGSADGAAPASPLIGGAPQQTDSSASPRTTAATDRIDLTPVLLRAKPPARELRDRNMDETTSFAFPEEAARPRNIGWRVGAGVLILVLAAQGAYLFRSEIAANVPELRPALNKVCEKLRCTVALPQRPRQISIEASDMQATDAANPGHITLTATLRNHATVELGYPALDVVLTNAKEHTVARRIFMPIDYLAGRLNPAAGIKPNAELTIRLELDTGDLGAAGFRLDLLPAA